MIHSGFLLIPVALAITLQLAVVAWLKSLGARSTPHRVVAFLALLMPAPVALAAIFSMFPALAEICATFLTSWDRALTFLFLLLACSGLGFALLAPAFRRLAMYRLALRAVRAGPYLTGVAQSVATRLGISAPAIYVLNTSEPVARTTCELRPKLFVSAWLLQHLDAEELETVVAHELAHIALGHHLAGLITRLLRDVSWYLPTGRWLQQFAHEGRERAADLLAAATTARPVALASALLTVWEASLVRPAHAAALSLLDLGEDIEGRIRVLLDLELDGTSQVANRPAHRKFLRSMNATLVLAQLIALAVMVPVLGCGLERPPI